MLKNNRKFYLILLLLYLSLYNTPNLKDYFFVKFCGYKLIESN